MRKIARNSVLTGILASSVVCGVLTGSVPGRACCSLAPASFTATKGWVGEAKKDGKLVHVLAYANSVRNLAKDSKGVQGNAMFLPIPAAAGTMTDENLLDMSNGRHVLEDMQTALRPPTRSEDFTLDFASVRRSSRVQVFDHGIYTVVLADHASDIPDALSRVPESKRPALNQKIFAAYEKWYPGWTFALCCFDNKDMLSAEPMLWWYEPRFPKVLFFPALDCHTGAVPNLNEVVDVDHFLAASSPTLDQLRQKVSQPVGRVGYRDTELPEEVKSLLPRDVVGAIMKTQLPNGDFLLSVDDVRAGKFKSKRVLPPGALALSRERSWTTFVNGVGF